jgi:hypothetical protein
MSYGIDVKGPRWPKQNSRESGNIGAWTMKFYTHMITGDTLSKEDWLSCYSAEELAERGFETAEAAFAADVRGGDLIEVER